MCSCIHCAPDIVASTEMIRSNSESRFLCTGTGTASATAVSRTLLDVRGSVSHDYHGKHHDCHSSSDHCHRRIPIVCQNVCHCSEAVASIGHRAFRDLAKVLGTIKIEDGDAAVLSTRLTWGESGCLRESEVCWGVIDE